MRSEELKQLQRVAWSAAAAPWSRWWPVFEASAQSVNERLVELAGVEPGARVLDIASGLGEPACTAARVAGGAGAVVGVDFAPDMVARATARAKRLGLAQVRFVEQDAERLQLGERFDVVLSRWGFMLMPDPVAALRAVRAHVAPGAPLALSWWAEPARVPFIALPMQVCHELHGTPLSAEDLPGPMRFGRPGAMEERLAAAGWSVEHVEEAVVAMRYASVEEFLAFEGEMSSTLQKLVRERGEAARTQVLAELERRARPSAGLDGALLLPSTVRIALARA